MSKIPQEAIAKLIWERLGLEHEVEWPTIHAAEYRLLAKDICELLQNAASKIPQEAIEAACRATVLGVNEDDNPVHLSKREALVAIKAALPFLTAPPAPQPAEITAQQAAKVLLDIYDNGHHPEFRSIVLASAFGSEAYDKGMDRFQGTHAMAKAFLTAIADPSSTELDYLRAKNQPVNAARPQVANDTPPEDFKWAHVETTIIADPSYPKFDLLSAAASPVEAGEA